MNAHCNHNAPLNPNSTPLYRAANASSNNHSHRRTANLAHLNTTPHSSTTTTAYDVYKSPPRQITPSIHAPCRNSYAQGMYVHATISIPIHDSLPAPDSSPCPTQARRAAAASRPRAQPQLPVTSSSHPPPRESTPTCRYSFPTGANDTGSLSVRARPIAPLPDIRRRRRGRRSASAQRRAATPRHNTFWKAQSSRERAANANSRTPAPARQHSRNPRSLSPLPLRPSPQTQPVRTTPARSHLARRRRLGRTPRAIGAAHLRAVAAPAVSLPPHPDPDRHAADSAFGSTQNANAPQIRDPSPRPSNSLNSPPVFSAVLASSPNRARYARDLVSYAAADSDERRTHPPAQRRPRARAELARTSSPAHPPRPRALQSEFCGRESFVAPTRALSRTGTFAQTAAARECGDGTAQDQSKTGTHGNEFCEKLEGNCKLWFNLKVD
ncbi:hypothetical protein B0H16DRAFT_1698387 [Mycena metata]|uniref:Uncharacterized protein n=1 Tax=Mycena metata TaxID=1033252 RepID=A0AAD7HR15_9AGAR|nr:hypothetical protein B0H16DRAFT_1698387 [Mycena metata]